jgi:hypothetical protein
MRVVVCCDCVICVSSKLLLYIIKYFDNFYIKEQDL